MVYSPFRHPERRRTTNSLSSQDPPEPQSKDPASPSQPIPAAQTPSTFPEPVNRSTHKSQPQPHLPHQRLPSKKASSLKARHPERRRATNPLSSQDSPEPQSKDPASPSQPIPAAQTHPLFRSQSIATRITIVRYRNRISSHLGFSRSTRAIFFARLHPFNCFSRAIALSISGNSSTKTN